MTSPLLDPDPDYGTTSNVGGAIAVAVLYCVGFIVIGIYLLGLFYYAIPLFIAGLIVSYAFIIRKIFNWKGYRKTWIICSFLLVCGATIYGGSWFYTDAVRIDQQADVDLADYEPFTKGTQAAQLDEKASLQLEEDLLKIDGATALYPIYASFVQAVYPEGKYDYERSIVRSTKTGNAYERLIKGEVDLIVAAGPSKLHEQLAESHGKEFTLTPIGREAFVFFVHEKNKITNLTIDQIQDIYTGNITNWKEVGGKRKDIRAFQRDENSGSQTAMQNFMGDVPLMNPIEENRIEFMGGIIDEVADYKNFKSAIGYTFRYYSTTMVGDHSIRLLDVNGIPPTVEHIQDGSYPISDEFYIVTAGSENPNLDPFIKWVLSEEGQQLIERSGYVPLPPVE